MLRELDSPNCNTVVPGVTWNVNRNTILSLTLTLT